MGGASFGGGAFWDAPPSSRAHGSRPATPRSPVQPLFDKGSFEQTGTFRGATASRRESEPMGTARERKFLDDYWSSWQS